MEYIEANEGGDFIYTTAVNPPQLQILRIDMELREETIDHVIINVQRMTSCTTNHHKFEMAQNT